MHVNTALTGIGALPECDADVSSLPAIYQVTVETYCAVRPQGPGAIDVLVRPSSMSNYKLRNGKRAESTNMILQLKDQGLMMQLKPSSQGMNRLKVVLLMPVRWEIR